MLSVAFKGILFLIVMFICISNNGAIIRNGFVLGNMHIAFVFALAIITSCKYNVIKYYLESKKKNKYIYAIIATLLFFALINIAPIFLTEGNSINNWLLSDYNKYQDDIQIRDFMFLPIYYNSLNILLMTICETVFSLILIWVAYVREEKQMRRNSLHIRKIFKECI